MRKFVKFYLAEKQSGIDLGLVLPEIAGFAFYNTSEYSLETLGASDTGDNLEHYISQFSKNVRTIFDEFKFGQTIEDLEKAKVAVSHGKPFCQPRLCILM